MTRADSYMAMVTTDEHVGMWVPSSLRAMVMSTKQVEVEFGAVAEIRIRIIFAAERANV